MLDSDSLAPCSQNYNSGRGSVESGTLQNFRCDSQVNNVLTVLTILKLIEKNKKKFQFYTVVTRGVA